MKKLVLTAVLSALLFAYIGYVFGVSNTFTCERKHQNFITDGRIVIIPVDTIDDRKIYNVLFNDEDGVDYMYPEEIANGLATGDWSYNENLQIK